MTSTANTTSTLQSIQLLRGIAALSVVYVHVLATPNFGLFGVDIFFVISGFVMALVTTKNTNPTSFFLHRLIRIVPLYWILTTCLVAVIVIAPNLLGSTTLNFANFLKSLFFIPYFKESHLIQPFLFVGWTLNYEMLFYLCIALGLMLSSRHYLAIAISTLMLIYLMLGVLADSPLLNGFFGNLSIFQYTPDPLKTQTIIIYYNKFNKTVNRGIVGKRNIDLTRPDTLEMVDIKETISPKLWTSSVQCFLGISVQCSELHERER
jgi:peptidoglycan/LPS O-acetylase OafA/YrhL